MIIVSFLVISLNLLFFTNSQFTDTVITYTTMCLTSFLAIDSLRDFSLLKQYLIKTSRIIAVFGILFLLLGFSNVISSLRIGGYRMGLGYACMTCVMMLLWSFAEKKKIMDLIGAVGLLALILIYGSRGPLVGIFLFAVYFGTRYFHKKGQNIMCVLLFIVMVVFTISFRNIMKTINKLLLGMGISSRTAYLFSDKSLIYGAGRNTIWSAIIEEIEKNPYRMRGINAEYSILGEYAHNMILELIYQFGIVIGGVIIFWLFAKMIETLRLNIEADVSVLCLIFMFACIPSLMFSGSLWVNQNFWIWLALIVGLKRERHRFSFR